ncbi:MAG TPA: rod shape-determining protein MreC [Candidatus Paceibacterota bacterium]|nr:rod shape-determining protein MreC [Candidatus Paceibacterota bacterium]
MALFNTHKKRSSRLHRTFEGILTLACIIALFFIIRALVPHTPILPSTLVQNDLAIAPRRTLLNKIADLQSTIDSLTATQTQIGLLTDENDLLKKELGRTPAPKGTLATVITLPNRSIYGTFIIDAGSAEGITEGETVYAFDNVAIGTVASVSTHRSTVLLFSAGGRESAGVTQGTNIAVTLIGRGSGEYEVRMPRDISFAVGDAIAYETTDTAIVAVVEKIVADPRDPFQTLLAKAPANLNTLKWVIVK